MPEYLPVMLKKLFILFFAILNLSFIYQERKGDKPVTGRASYYGTYFHGRKTANGEIYNKHLFTAAHRKYPFNTYVRVQNLKNGLSITVRINDRGPFNYSRVIDLSEAAARRIGSYKHGLTMVEIQPVNLITLTKEIDSIFNSNEVVDCLGNPESLGEHSLSLYRTGDLVHMIYIANELYLHEDVEKVYIVSKDSGKKKIYHLVVSDYSNNNKLMTAKDYFERKGFTQVQIYKHQH
jgi:hypothetical protein